MDENQVQTFKRFKRALEKSNPFLCLPIASLPPWVGLTWGYTAEHLD
jgi:hypothetical protein